MKGNKWGKKNTGRKRPSHREKLKNLWKDPNSLFNSPNRGKKISESHLKRYKETPKLREKQSKRTKELWKNPEYREKMSQMVRGKNNPMYGKTEKRHPNWNPNREEVVAPYTEKFYDYGFRLSILESQKYFCPICKNRIKEKDYDSLGR